MSHGLLGPLETVDPHDPLGPLHDRESSALKEVQQFQEAQEDQQVHAMGTNAKLNPRYQKRPVLLTDSRIASRGRGESLT